MHNYLISDFDDEVQLIYRDGSASTYTREWVIDIGETIDESPIIHTRLTGVRIILRGTHE